jgi:hypothetical protein
VGLRLVVVSSAHLMYGNAAPAPWHTAGMDITIVKSESGPHRFVRTAAGIRVHPITWAESQTPAVARLAGVA